MLNSCIHWEAPTLKWWLSLWLEVAFDQFQIVWHFSTGNSWETGGWGGGFMSILPGCPQSILGIVPLTSSLRLHPARSEWSVSLLAPCIQPSEKPHHATSTDLTPHFSHLISLVFDSLVFLKQPWACIPHMCFLCLTTLIDCKPFVAGSVSRLC